MVYSKESIWDMTTVVCYLHLLHSVYSYTLQCKRSSAQLVKQILLSIIIIKNMAEFPNWQGTMGTLWGSGHKRSIVHPVSWLYECITWSPSSHLPVLPTHLPLPLPLPLPPGFTHPRYIIVSDLCATYLVCVCCVRR